MTQFFYIGFYFLKQLSVSEVVCEEQIATLRCATRAMTGFLFGLGFDGKNPTLKPSSSMRTKDELDDLCATYYSIDY